MPGPHVVVVGGSIAGLATALALSRDGYRVSELERDATELPASPLEAFESWDRRGAPQVRHSHAFLARVRNLIRDEAPDLLSALLEAGAEELRLEQLLAPTIEDRSPQPGDEDLVMLACRRVTFEWALRRLMLAGGRVDFQAGVEVLGLLADAPGADTSGLPRARGVRLRRRGAVSEELRADLVVDASGRRSRIGRWLAESGAERLQEEAEPCGIFYSSRFYRLRPGEVAPPRTTALGADLGYLKYGVFPGDAGIFSITMAALPDDSEMRSVLRTGPFEAAAEVLPATAPWVARSEAVTGVHAMDKLMNTRRCFVRDGRPLALGVFAIGDAAIHSNPMYGRGCTLAFVHAYLLRDALRAHGRDLVASGMALESAVEREIVPWYQNALTQDRDAIEVAQAQLRGEDPFEPSQGAGPVDPKVYMRALLRHGLIPALRSDAFLARAFLRGMNLLTTPENMLRDSEVLRRVLLSYERRHERKDAPAGPTRAEMLELLRRAA